DHHSGARVHGETTPTSGYSSFAAGSVSARARGGIAVTAFPGAVARSISSLAATGAPGALATSSPRAVATQRAGPVPTPGTRTGTAENTCHRDHRGAVGLVGFTEHPAHRERIPRRRHMAVHTLHVAVRVLATPGSVVG